VLFSRKHPSLTRESVKGFITFIEPSRCLQFVLAHQNIGKFFSEVERLKKESPYTLNLNILVHC